MNLDQISTYCLAKRSTTQEIKFEHLLCFCVLGKIFFAISLDDDPLRATGKVGEENFECWIDQALFIQSPYFAKRQWITCTDIGQLSEQTMIEWIDLSYESIISRFSKKIRIENGWY